MYVYLVAYLLGQVLFCLQRIRNRIASHRRICIFIVSVVLPHTMPRVPPLRFAFRSSSPFSSFRIFSSFRTHSRSAHNCLFSLPIQGNVLCSAQNETNEEIREMRDAKKQKQTWKQKKQQTFWLFFCLFCYSFMGWTRRFLN